jgi:mRNA-degrading endonuclease RelE of RelBE toxin-antitoxin system
VKFTFRPSFDRSIKSLDPSQKEDLKTLCLTFLDLLETHSTVPAGMGLKRLHENYWEIRQGLRNRILFRWRKDEIDFILAGDHDSIREFLKNL